MYEEKRRSYIQFVAKMLMKLTASLGRFFYLANKKYKARHLVISQLHSHFVQPNNYQAVKQKRLLNNKHFELCFSWKSKTFYGKKHFNIKKLFVISLTSLSLQKF